MAYTQIPSFTKKGSFTEDTEFVIVVDGVEYLITYKTLSDTFGNTPELLTELKTEIDALRAIVDAFPTDNPAAPIALKIADIPTIDGIYKPVEAGTYPNAGGLIYTPTEGITYFIRTQGVWAKDVTPINFTPTGVVEDGNTQAVSGGEVYKSFLKKEVPELEFGGINLSTGALSDADTRVRNIGFINTTDIDLIKLTSPDLFIRNIVYYNNGVFVSQETAGLVNDITPTIPPTANQCKIVLSKNPDTEIITQLEIDNSKIIVSYNTEYNLGLIDNLEPIKIDYDNAIIDLNTSENELGGISVNWGVNSDNNIRIRSKSKISVLQQEYSIENVTPGYVLSRIFRYKDGVFLDLVGYPSNTFTPDSTYNEIRLVWEKTDNTEVISQEELNDFSFNLLDDSLEYKITEIAKRISEIPIIKKIVDSLKYGRLFGKTVSFLGDSITTYLGFIPVGNADYYPQSDVNSVTKTWWHKVIEKTGMVLEVNNSWSGSPISGTVARAFGSRIGNIGTPDVCFIFGGTNDYTMGIPLGDWNYADNSFNKNVFKQALQSLLYNLITTYPTTEFIFITPLNRNDAGDGRVNGFPVNWNNEKYLADYQDAMVEACSVYGVKCLDTREIFSYYNVSQYTIEGLHPKENGMTIIADWVVSKIL